MNKRHRVTMFILLLSVLLCITSLMVHLGNCGSSEHRLDATLELLAMTGPHIDGAMVAAYDTTIIELLNINPHAVIPWLSEHESIRRDMLIRMNYTVFTDRIGDGVNILELSEMRTNTIGTLMGYNINTEQEDSVRSELLNAVNTITIRTID